MRPDLHLWLIPLLPLAGAAINGFFGKNFPKKLVTAIAWAFPGAAFLQFLWIVSQFSGLTMPYAEDHGAWIAIQGFQVNFGFYLDQLSLVMLGVVTGVGFLIHIYAAGYMWEDHGYYRFFAYLNLFMFFMLVLILASNYLLMFVGWEGVGLASYLLIGFYFLKDSASQAGKKAFIVNRIGDFAFLLGMFMLVKYFGSLDYTTVFRTIAIRSDYFVPETASAGLLTLIGFCFLIGATGKSAQVPLYVWLPDAMEGPTPVSALIHAATMVTAGVYMVARSHAIYDLAPMALKAVAIVGAVTALFAATIGITQTDIKRVLAYSTVSQLGYMFLGCGVAAYSAGIFHLMTHAFFKALLFLSAGSVIHALSGEQDMRNMGGLRKLIPWTFGVMTVGTIAIAGIPPFAGFFSKDEILWKVWSSGEGGKVLWAMGLVTALMTSFYMFRLLFMTFWGERREGAVSSEAGHGGHDDHGHGHGVHESPWVMLAPLVILAVLSVVGGWAWKPAVLFGENKFEKFMAPVFEKHEAAEPAGNVPHGEITSVHEERVPAPAEHGEGDMELVLALLSIGAGVTGAGLAYYMYVAKPETPERIAESIQGIYELVYHKYYVDEVYYEAVVDPIVDISRAVLWKTVDVGVIDGTVNGVGSVARTVGGELRKIQSGNIRSYAGWVAIGAAAILAYVIYMGVQ